MVKRLSSFRDVIGHDWLMEFLNNHVTNNTLPRFIIFDGPEGCGKTSIATLLALNLVYGLDNSEEKNTAYDELCHNNRSTNYIKKFKLSVDNGKDAAKDVLAEMHTTFTAGHRKIIIGDEAHNLSEAAQDVFLEDSEFLPENVYLFLLTTDVAKLKPALRSRAVPLHVPALKMSDMIAVLEREVQARHLNIQAKDATLQLIAEWADCRPRTGLSLLNAFADNSDISSEVIQNLIGYLSVDDVLPLFKALCGSITFGLSYINEMPINQSLITITSEVIRVLSHHASYKLKMTDVVKIKTELGQELDVDVLVDFLYGITSQPNLNRTCVIHAFLHAHKQKELLWNKDTATNLQLENQQRAKIVPEISTPVAVPSLDDLLANCSVIKEG